MYRSKLFALILLISFIFNFCVVGIIPAAAEENGDDSSPKATAPPRITSVYPNFYKGSDIPITVLGDNFVEGLTVMLGNKPVQNVELINKNRLRFTIPEDFGESGVVSLTIDNGYDVVELKNAFTFVENGDPTIIDVSPNTGGIDGGTPVTISGTNFRQDVSPIPPTVMFVFADKELPAQEVIVVSTTEIIAYAPAVNSEQKARIRVINPADGGSYTTTDEVFEYISEGKVIRMLNITPSQGTMDGGTPILIRGVNLPTSKNDYKSLEIRIGDVPVEDIDVIPYGYDENGEPIKDENGNPIYVISAKTGSSQFSGPHDVRLIIEWADSHEKKGRTEIAVLPDGFTYYFPRTYPHIEDVINTTTQSNVGPVGGGHEIRITGSNFEAGAEVYFGANKAEVISLTSTLIRVKLPPSDLAGPVDVIVVNKTEGEITGQAIKPGGFTYRGTSMKISSVTPNYATTAEIKDVVITGENFNEDTLENTKVYFEYLAPDPDNPEQLIIRRETLTNVQFASDIGVMLTAKTPKNPASGWKDLVVENSYGRAVLRNAFEFRSPDIVPKIESVWAVVYEGDTPTSPEGPTSGGTRFRIVGNNFVTGSKVYVGDNLATDIDVISFTEIEATSPAGEPGWQSVTVESITGKRDTMPAWDGVDPSVAEGKKGFYYFSNPTIEDVSPSRGSVHGGNIITITGEQFYPGLTVTFGYEGEDGEFHSVTEAVYDEHNMRLVDNNTIQLRLPKLIIDELSDEQRKELEEKGELAVQVQVKNKDKRSDVWSKTFLYKIPKDEVVIKEVTPAVGRVEGGPQIVIRGDNFHPDASVHFGWEEAEIVSLSKTQIVVTAPPHPVGKCVVTVSNHFDTGNAIWYPFEYLDPSSYPKIEGVYPPMGPVDGGTKITITGIGFWPGAEIWIGGKRALEVEANYTYATAITPKADNVGPADVMIVNPDGGTDILPGGFTYKMPDSKPEIDSISPSIIPATGGTIVTIKGKDFRKWVTVYFGTEVAEIVHFIEPNEIIVKAPPYLLPIEEKAVVDVTVLNRDGGVAQKEGAVTYVLPKSEPIIDSIDPDHGPAAGGTLVVIEGDGFSSKGVTVYFGGNEAIVQSIRYDRLEVITPPGQPGETVHVTVTNHDPDALGSYTAERAFTYVASKPEIFTVAPNQGSYEGGTKVTITGRDFTSVVRAVYIGEWEGKEVEVVDPETITFTTPRIADSPEELPELKWFDVKVINADGMEAVKKEAFRFLVPDSNPVIDYIEPDHGPTVGGLPVTIYGTDFRERAQVVIGGKNAEVLMIDDTPGEGNAKIIVKIPPHTPGTKDVVVINYEGARSNVVTFEYIAPKSFPEIHSVEPSQGSTLGDTEVIITGIGFKEDDNTQEPPRVWFGMNEAPKVEFIDYKTLRVITPPGEEGSVDVLVLNPDMGQAIKTNGFRYIKTKELVIDEVSPNEGPATGGTAITITGGPFDRGAIVLIGGNPAADVVVENSGTITATTPPGEVGWQEVRVKNPDGGWAALENGFKYTKPRTAPETPGWVDTERKDRETIEITWEEVDFANYYEIWVSHSRYGQYRFLDQTTRTVYYATGLDPNTTYYFQIRAVNELGTSDFSYYVSARTGSGRIPEADLVPEKIVMETANGNAVATVATANALAGTGYRIDFSQAQYQDTNRKVLRISQGALSRATLPIVVEAKGINLSIPAASIYLGLLASNEDYAEVIITDLGQQEAERALRALPRGSRILTPVYAVEWRILQGTGSSVQNTFYQQVQLTMRYDTAVTPGKQVSLYTYNPATGRWVNTGAANKPNTPELTIGITAPGRFMLVEH
ncbi:MAG TPA: hypothetical protein GXX34_05290 [Clostridia bacterium]|nr:hypothetical protein [Clostridia bacterium]